MPFIVLGSIVGLVIATIVVLILLIWSWSPGKIAPFLDESGNVLTDSVSEIVNVEINGMKQGMIIKGRSDKNPVLLFLHGGPGNPEYVFTKDYPLNLEDYFTVCWWDQRGGGMSYSSSIKPGTITLEQMISDTVQVTNYIRERFNKEKIYLMGHSWGSFLGIHTIQQYPELFEAYIGIGQVTDQLESERLGYEHMLSIAQSENDKKTIKKLTGYKLIGAKSVTQDYLMLRSNIMSKQGNGMLHAPPSKLSLLMSVFQTREYTLSDKYGYAMGSLLSLNQPMNDSQFATNIFESITKLSVPIYIIHGVYDRQVSYQLSKEYFEVVDAPLKFFYTFENSAHSPLLEEPERFMQIIKNDVLAIRYTASRLDLSLIVKQ